MGDRTEPNTARIDVQSTSHRYAVVIGERILERANDILRADGFASPAAVVSNNRVWRLHGRTLQKSIGKVKPVLMGDGEKAKNLASVRKIYDALSERKVERSGLVAAFGGGVVGDVAGFAAATYLRGVPVVQIPTTLLAQVDSSIGGKVGVNLGSGKNLAGAFHSPSMVLIDPSVLRTLPAREFRAGLYEIVKYGVIRSRELFDRVSADLDRILERDSAVLTPLIADCCRIKADVVQQDERESGPRRVLNFGHTIGHALEAVTGYRRFLHGEAVGLGMVAAARLSAMRGLLTTDHEATLTTLVRSLGKLPAVKDLKAARVAQAVAHDKKVRNGRLHFVLSAGLGRTEIVSDVTEQELELAIRSLGITF